MNTATRFVILAATANLFIGCDGYVKATGVVRTQSGEPLTGAVAELDRGSYNPKTMATDDGRFRIGCTVAPLVRLNVPLYVGKPGYKSCRIEVRSMSDNVVRVELADGAAPEPSLFSLNTDDDQRAVRSPCGAVPEGWEPVVEWRKEAQGSQPP